MIGEELATARSNLKDRQRDLDKARKHVAELDDTCQRLDDRVKGLERDEAALTRGYIAIMGDVAQPA